MHILLNTYIQSYINIHISKYNLFSPIMLSVYIFSKLTLTFEIRYFCIFWIIPQLIVIY